MKTADKIKIALSEKGYTLKEAYFEPISYGGREGREGGWYVEVQENEESEIPETAEKWDELALPDGVIGAYMPYAFICYNVKDALKMIDLLPKMV